MTSAFQRLQESLAGAAEAAQQKISNVTSVNEKILDMWPNTVDASKNNTGMTTDHGVAVQDTDHWLRATDGERPGPALLEDQIAREKIHRCKLLMRVRARRPG